jgi:D-3-phosphoglycerate dehydrogenase / 2-oxoglutarate reductase
LSVDSSINPAILQDIANVVQADTARTVDIEI